MELMQGFKQTEVGVIPIVWDVVPFDEIANKHKKWSITGGPFGSNLKVSDYTVDGVQIIQLQNIGDGVFHDESQIFTSFEKANELLSCNIYAGEIILSKMGDPVARACFIPNKAERYVMASDGIRLVVDESKFSKKFIHDYINSSYFRRRAFEISTGTTRQRIGLPELKTLLVICPPLPEQTAIANALSDMDALISQTEMLIEKKKAIKQGAMQELLKPKEGWVAKKLGELLKYEQPTAYIVTDTEYHPNNETPVLTAGKSFILGYTNETNNIFENTPVVIFDDFTTSCQYVDFRFKVKSSAMKILKPANDNVNMRFAFEVLKSIKYQVGDHKRHWIGEFINFEVIIPSKIEEQNRIGQIIEDIEKEQQSYQVKLSKLKQQKQGMMQALLTGKIRLVS